MRLMLILFFISNIYSQKVKDESSAFLSLGNVGLEKLNDVEEKKKFLETVYMEKERVQDYVLKRILDNAYELYQKGDYEGAQTVAKKVLSIDPTYEEARIIADATAAGTQGTQVSRSLSFDKQMEEALLLYQKGEILDAYKRMAVLQKLSPKNVKVKYWYKKIEGDLKDYYVSKAEGYYNSGDKKTALSMYYKAIEYAPKDETIATKIAQLESEIRQDMMNQKLKSALELYAQGKLEESYSVLKEAVAINPADERTTKLFSELKNEIETKYVKAGNDYFKKKNYNMAIKSYTVAMKYSDNPSKIDKMISNVKETMKKEEELRKKKEEERRRKEEERKKKEEEEKKKQQTESAAAEKKPEDKKDIVTEQNRLAAQKHYLEGIKYLQSGDYQKAKESLTIAKKLDPTNPDIDAALKRIEQVLGGGQ